MENDIVKFLQNSDKPKILIVQPSRMGDIIFALPAVVAIKKEYPNSHISWIVDERCAEIVRENYLIDNLIVFDRTHITFSYLKQLYKQLRAQKFDLSIDFHGLFKSAFIVKLAGAKYKLASSSTNGMRELSWLFSKEIKPNNVDTHCIQRHLAVAKYLGCSVDINNLDYNLYIAEKYILEVKEILKKEKISLDKKIVLVHPGGGWISRRWQKEKFAKLIDLINENFDVNVILIGGKEGGASEKGLDEDIIYLSKTKKVINLTGKLTLKQLMAIFKLANLFIANEAGPMHIATALKIPAIAILGPTDAKRTGPFGKTTTIFQKKVYCQPCRNRTCRKVDCMKLVLVDEVFCEVSRKLKQ